jgi:hypothetical protein
MVVVLLIFFFLFFHASAVAVAGPVDRATRAAVEVLVGCSLTVSDDMLGGGGVSRSPAMFIRLLAVSFDTRWQVWGGVI